MPSRLTPQEAWIGLTTSGLAALARDDTSGAAALWISAADLARDKDLPEPLSAAAHNNAGIAYLISAQTADALFHFTQARRRWVRTLGSLRAEPLEAPSANSVFHLKLAIKYHDAFARLQQDRSARLCRTARAITALNRAMAVAAGMVRGPHRDVVADALADTLGPRCPELDMLAGYASDRRTIAPPAAFYQRKLDSVLHLRQRQSASTNSDIELAARLTMLIHPALRAALPSPEVQHPAVEKN